MLSQKFKNIQKELLIQIFLALAMAPNTHHNDILMMTRNRMTLTIINPFATLNMNDTQYNDIQQNCI
jgi:hypothetical protein